MFPTANLHLDGFSHMCSYLPRAKPSYQPPFWNVVDFPARSRFGLPGAERNGADEGPFNVAETLGWP